jgi:purine-nucleoside phosphorylase
MSLREQVTEAARYVSSLSAPKPSIGVVLGSGLGAFGDTLGDLLKVPYADVPHLPRSTVIGHAGNLCLGRVGATPVACLQGRVHLYEGHGPLRCTFAVRLLAALGCRVVLLTNAAGGIHPEFAPGDLMLITDHLNLTAQNPLTGPNEDALGPRFPDLSQAYDIAVAQAARRAATERGVTLREGVYACMPGPSYETPAEIRMLRTLGADAVGMSTVLEVIALRHQGVRVGAVSCITNLAAGISPTPLDHSEVEAIARQTRDRFVGLLERWVELVALEIPA